MLYHIAVWVIFFVFYWMFIWLGTAFFCSDPQVSWSLLGADSWGWKAAYYLAPIFSFALAAMLSGLMQASRVAKRFPWRRVIVFIIVFWIVDRIILFIDSSPWYSSPGIGGEPRFILNRILFFHEFIAQALAIIITVIMIGKFKLRLTEKP
ncbi:MAG: hypothetical protein NTU54_08850 [Candidatus Omnitrophica bacterium]|nr:hypothetical protein [Candidatus Omnitrophota bacterium]